MWKIYSHRALLMETSVITPDVRALFHRFFLMGIAETGVRRLHHKSGVGTQGSRVGWQGRDKPCPYYDTVADPASAGVCVSSAGWSSISISSSPRTFRPCLAIFSRNLSRPSISASGRGGQPGT